MINWFKTQFTENLKNIFKLNQNLDAELIEKIENALLSADVGYHVSSRIIEFLKQAAKNQSSSAEIDWLKIVKQKLVDILMPCQKPLSTDLQHPYLMLVVGVNGVGKTTTIAKLANYYLKKNKKVMLAAGDTFRSAAIEQLQHWGTKHKVPVVAQQSGADGASVIYDSYQSAIAKNIDILIADTAGRLHTQTNFMQELIKIKKVVQKINFEAPHEIMLILDASMGQNAIMQAKEFHKALGITGIIVTKLDGTAKGGVIFAIAEDLKLPIRFLGIGEKPENLIEFDAVKLVEGLFDDIAI